MFGLADVGCWSRVLCRQWSSVRPHTARGGRLLQSPRPGNLKAVYSWDHKAAAACRHQQRAVKGLQITITYTAGVGEKGGWMLKM